MVKPNLVGKNLTDFNRIAEQFNNYIKAGGLEKLTNVTMQGSADASPPSWLGPTGELIDHNYGGIKFQKNPKPDVLRQSPSGQCDGCNRQVCSVPCLSASALPRPR